MYCQKCGAENPEEAKFCRNCGWQMSNSENQVKQDPQFAEVASSEEPKWLIEELNKLLNK